MEVHVVGTHTFTETPASSVTGIARREREVGAAWSEGAMAVALSREAG